MLVYTRIHTCEFVLFDRNVLLLIHMYSCIYTYKYVCQLITLFSLTGMCFLCVINVKLTYIQGFKLRSSQQSRCDPSYCRELQSNVTDAASTWESSFAYWITWHVIIRIRMVLLVFIRNVSLVSFDCPKRIATVVSFEVSCPLLHFFLGFIVISLNNPLKNSKGWYNSM